MRRAAPALMYLGVVGIVIGLSKVHARYVAPVPYSWHSSQRFAWSITYIVLQCIISYGIGLPDLPRVRRSAVLAAVVAVAAGGVSMSLLQLAVGSALLPRFVVGSTMLLLVPWYLVCVRLSDSGRSRAETRDRILLVGGRQDADQLTIELSGEVEQPASLVGHLGVADASPTDGRLALVELVDSTDATVIVLDNDARLVDAIVQQAASLHEQGIRIRTLTSFYSEWLGKLPLFELERAGLMFDIGEVHRPVYARLRRMLDIPLALVGLVVLVVLIPFVALGDLFGNRGSLFYRQVRVGKQGSKFWILKFRTMVDTEQSESNDWTVVGDPRITKFGSFLRLTHLDELPQVINILRGDLAIVGPRPEQPRYVAELRRELPFYDLRHLVHPGLTGWAQVKYGYAGTERDAREKLQYEFYYLGHQSLTFDIRIIGRTIRSVIGRGGR